MDFDVAAVIGGLFAFALALAKIIELLAKKMLLNGKPRSRIITDAGLFAGMGIKLDRIIEINKESCELQRQSVELLKDGKRDHEKIYDRLDRLEKGVIAHD